jgi:hypothetical protein
VDLLSDPAFCGACTVACGTSMSCINGLCSCAPETNRCGNQCVNVLVDPANCGGCGKSCSPGQTCVNGTCQ